VTPYPVKAQGHAFIRQSLLQKKKVQTMIFDRLFQMASTPRPRCSLQETINRGEFYNLDERTLLHQISESFGPELARLKNAVAVEGNEEQRNSNGTVDSPSPSQILCGTNYDEINRTLVGILALRWIHNGDYKRFTTGQIEEFRLTEDSFQALRKLFTDNVQSPDDLFTLVLSMIINDLGKDPNLRNDYANLTHTKISDQNHDSLLLEAANADMIPALRYLDAEKRAEVMKGLELGSELNAGQLAQAESVPFNLEGLYNMRGHQHAFELKFLEQVLDVAGAAGHLYSRGSKNFIEPVFQAFKTVHEVSIDIIEGNSDLRQGYDKVLTKRGNMLYGKGFRRLSVSNDEERALLRLLTMGRTADLEQAKLFSDAFHALAKTDKDKLIAGLNVDGNVNETAVLPYYMPAILSKTLETTRDSDDEGRCKALTSLMRYLAKVLEKGANLQVVPEDMGFNFSGEVPGIIIERNMSKAQEVISSPAFKLNPDLLDQLDIPDGQVLQRRRTSQSM
jgi:hypothetical protein